MATTRSPQVRARERARAQLADKLAAQRAREKANEDDLAAFFAHAEKLDTAAATRDAAIAAAHQTYTDAIRAAQTDQHQRIRALAERGEKVPDIADLTGWSATEVRKALRALPEPPTTAPRSRRHPPMSLRRLSTTARPPRPRRQSRSEPSPRPPSREPGRPDG